MRNNVTYTVYFTISIRRIRRNKTKQIGLLNDWVGIRKVDANTEIIFFNIYYNVHTCHKKIMTNIHYG